MGCTVDEPGAGWAVLGVEHLRVGHAGVVIDHGVHILIADLLTRAGCGAAQDTPSASIRYFAQFLDIHVYQFTWAVSHIPDRCTGGAVQVKGLSNRLCEGVGSWVFSGLGLVGWGSGFRVGLGLFSSRGRRRRGFLLGLLVMFFGGEAQQLESGLVRGEMPPGFGDFPELIVDAFHEVGGVHDSAKLWREPQGTG